jgi:uncharacterized membrane protein
MAIVPVKTHITLDHITFTYNGQGHYYNPLYLWTVFFKIDGDTAFVDATTLKLQGTATVVVTPGNHGDLPGLGSNHWTSGPLNTDTPYQATIQFPIPAVLGDFETLVTPMPLKNSNGTTTPIAPGVVGCLAVLMSNDGLPDDDIPPGHEALNNAVQKDLNNLIPTLGATNQQVTQAQIQAITQQVIKAVTAAVTNAVSFGTKVLVLLGAENPDAAWGNAVYQFAAGNNDCGAGSSDLACSPPAGIPLQGQTISIDDGWETYSFTFQGKVIADPFPLSMKRILSRLGEPSLRNAMTTTTATFTPRDSANSWANVMT